MPARTMQRFVDEIASDIAVRQSETDGAVALVKRMVTTVVSHCGWKKRSQTRATQLQELLEDKGIYPSPRVDDLAVPSASWITFSERPPPASPDSPTFRREEALQGYLESYYVRVFREHPELAGLELVRHQAPIQAGRKVLKADLLLKGPDGGRVAVELKVGDPGRGATAQLRKYMDGLKHTYPNVRGVLITARPSRQDRETAIAKEINVMADEYPIQWFWYSVDVDLQRPD